MEEHLVALLTAYTEQLEAYERDNSTFTMSVIGALVTFIGAVMAINTPKVYLFATLAVPCLETLFLFVFTHHIRWIAFYRVQCMYLEDQLNKLTDTKHFYYHNRVQKHGMDGFTPVLGLMYLCFGVIYVICPIAYCHVIDKFEMKIPTVFHIACVAFFLLSLIGIGTCTIAIIKNEAHTKKVMVPDKN